VRLERRGEPDDDTIRCRPAPRPGRSGTYRIYACSRHPLTRPAPPGRARSRTQAASQPWKPHTPSEPVSRFGWKGQCPLLIAFYQAGDGLSIRHRGGSGVGRQIGRDLVAIPSSGWPPRVGGALFAAPVVWGTTVVSPNAMVGVWPTGAASSNPVTAQRQYLMLAPPLRSSSTRGERYPVYTSHDLALKRSAFRPSGREERAPVVAPCLMDRSRGRIHNVGGSSPRG
jgi:hypothetical protein